MNFNVWVLCLLKRNLRLFSLPHTYSLPIVICHWSDLFVSRALERINALTLLFCFVSICMVSARLVFDLMASRYVTQRVVFEWFQEYTYRYASDLSWFLTNLCDLMCHFWSFTATTLTINRISCESFIYFRTNHFFFAVWPLNYQMRNFCLLCT